MLFSDVLSSFLLVLTGLKEKKLLAFQASQTKDNLIVSDKINNQRLDSNVGRILQPRNIYTVRHIIGRFVKGGNTVNVCAVDHRKAFDKVNHHALFKKLMKRNLPVALLDIFENWLKTSFQV